jgi:hypothetical protein
LAVTVIRGWLAGTCAAAIAVASRLFGPDSTREEDMLAESGPESPLDTRRLSDFSPRREKSHGASRVHRIHLRQCSQPQTGNRWTQTSGSAGSSVRNPTPAPSAAESGRSSQPVRLHAPCA